jgi:hypothetical protein
MDLVIKKLIKKVSETLFPVGIPQGLAIVPRSPKSRSAINCPIGFASDFGRRSVPKPGSKSKRPWNTWGRLCRCGRSTRARD